ncbi:MAG: acetamidase/formamidase family protein [Acidobacteria bacterium]|nr:acetamidase/formamidase family protein [Acidobacteriota bacterium]
MRVVLTFFAFSAAWAQSDLSGGWKLRIFQQTDRPDVTRLSLRVDGEKLTGWWRGRELEGTVAGRAVEFKVGKDPAKALLEGGELKGEITFGDRTVKWSAEKLPPRQPPRTHDFEPTEFQLYFASSIKPVLRIQPGDTVRTWGVDAGGVDRSGKRRSPGGNPQTGPFFVEGALPGDTLVVRLNQVRINRDWARSGDSIMRNALEPWSLGNLKWAEDFGSRWKLDRDKGIAYLEKPTDRLKNFSVPLRPMLGCVGVAPPGESSIRTTDSGRFGGNMDYNEIREGATLYLPVYHEGALLFLGDGHAAQGDGELTGDALETSMDFEFTVDILPGKQFGHPLAETDQFLISIGIAGSLQDALQMATSGMLRWLDRDYKLSPSEAAMVMGFAVKYDIADLVGTQVSIAAKLPKAALAKLEKAPPAP